jgi:hypothetical protein
MRRTITGTLALALILVALGLNQPSPAVVAQQATAGSLAVQILGPSHDQPAARAGGASGGVIGDIDEAIPQGL